MRDCRLECSNLVSPGNSVTIPSLFTLENSPEHKLGSQLLNWSAVLKVLNYTEMLLAGCRHCYIHSLWSHLSPEQTFLLSDGTPY